MKKKIVIMLLILFSQLSSAELKGDFRKNFIESNMTTCYKNQRESQENKNLSNKTLVQYCSCYVNYLADSPNPQLIQDVYEGKKRISALKGIIQLAEKYCNQNYTKY